MRIGAKKKPFYRVVVVDERSKNKGAYVELVGTYNPLTEPKDIKLKQDRIDYWVKQGAQGSTGYLRIIGKAPQKLPRKPKKASNQVTGDSKQADQQTSESAPVQSEPAESADTAETPNTETPKEETPAEEPATGENETKNE